MDDEGGLNLPVIGKLADHLVEAGVSGVFVCGSTGESLSLSTDERKQCLEAWTKSCAGRIKVIAHVGHNALPDAVELARHAGACGADGISAMPPTFFKPRSVEALVDWCGEVASSAPDLPFYYYHIPSMTGVAHKMHEFLTVAGDRIPSLAGVKFTHSDLMDYRQCLTLEDGRFDVLFGTDEIMLSALAMGAKGFIGSTYNLAPGLYLDIISAFADGRLEDARDLQSKSIAMVDRLVDLGALPAFKAVMRLHGIDCGPTRSPFPRFGEAELKAVAAAWEELGIGDR